jgi:hypothetical protein
MTKAEIDILKNALLLLGRKEVEEYKALPQEDFVFSKEFEEKVVAINKRRKSFFYQATKTTPRKIAIVFVAAIIINPSFLNFLSIALWCLPFVKYLWSFNNHMKEDDNRITKLKNAADNLLNNVGLILDGDELIQKEIELQNGIFEHRKKALLIPNFFYKMCRTMQQKNEEAIAAHYKKVD